MFNIFTQSLKTFLRQAPQKFITFEYNSLWKITRSSYFIMGNSPKREGCFKGTKDRYDGITVSSNEEPCATNDFLSTLLESLHWWKQNEVRGVWFKVFLMHADWVPILAQNGFQFHHAKSDYVMMYKWLPENDDECNIPQYSHTTVGVGAIVVNTNEEILVVREKYLHMPHWKLPGGYVEPGEDIIDAAIREVAEETSVRTEFQTVVAYRHTRHGIQFGCSDLYFIVSLKPLSDEIKKCDKEIAACEWMKVTDFLNHPNVNATNRQFVKTYLEYCSSGLKIIYEKNIHSTLNRPQCIYSATLTYPSHKEVDPPRCPSDNDTISKLERENV